MAAGKTPSAANGGTSPGGGGKKRNEITVVGFLIREDGSRVPMETITPEERESWERACCQRLSERMSDYFTQHPEEWAKI